MELVWDHNIDGDNARNSEGSFVRGIYFMVKENTGNVTLSGVLSEDRYHFTAVLRTNPAACSGWVL